MGCETSCANAPKNTLYITDHVSVISVMLSPINSNHSQMDCFVQKHVQTNNIKLPRRCSFVRCSYCRGYDLVILSANNAESNSITSSWRVAGAWPAACLVGQVSWCGLVGPVSVWLGGWWRLGSTAGGAWWYSWWLGGLRPGVQRVR